MEWFLMWVARILITIWVVVTLLNYFILYRRCKLLEDPISYKQALGMGIVLAIPLINIIILWASFDSTMQMFFNSRQFIKERLPDIKADKILRRRVYAEEFIQSLDMKSQLDEYIEARLLMGKLTTEDEKKS